MGGYLRKKMFLQLLTPVMLLHLLISSSSGAEVNSSENGVCVSKGRRSVPYELEGKLPKPADLDFKNLNMCKAFHLKTCCSASRMLSASLAVQNLATYGEASQDCLHWFELLECSICHPDVGVKSSPLRICASFCDSVFEACSDAYFSSDASNQVIVPCGASNGTICEKASKLETNGTTFCEAMGFSVHDSEEEPCYGSKSILVTVVESLMNTVRLQDLKYNMVILCLELCWIASVLLLASTLWNMWDDQMERDMRRFRGRNRNRGRF